MTFFILLPHLSRSPSGLFLSHLPTSAACFSTFLASLLSIHVTSWFCGCGFSSALSLTLPFTLALPVLPLHAASRGGGSVGARASVAHSHWGGSELREATLHPGKPLCQPAYLSLWLHFSVIITFLFSDFYRVFSSSLLPFSLCALASSFSPPMWHLSVWHITVCCSSLAHLSFAFLSHSSLHHTVICHCQFWRVITQRHILFDYGNNFNHGDGTSAGDSK